MTYDAAQDPILLGSYTKSLVGKFFKIIPIKESGDPSLPVYLNSLLRELTGNQRLVLSFQSDDRYLSILGILRYMAEEDPDIGVVRQDVFRAIDLIKKLQAKYVPIAR